MEWKAHKGGKEGRKEGWATDFTGRQEMQMVRLSLLLPVRMVDLMHQCCLLMVYGT